MVNKPIISTHKSKSNIIIFEEEIDRLKVVVNSYYSIFYFLVYVIAGSLFIPFVSIVGLLLLIGIFSSVSVEAILTISSILDLFLTIIGIWFLIVCLCMFLYPVVALPTFVKEVFSRHHRQNILEITPQTFSLYWSHIRKYRKINDYKAQSSMGKIQRLMSDYNLNSNHIEYIRSKPIYLYKNDCVYQYDKRETAEQIRGNRADLQRMVIDSYLERTITISSGSRGRSGSYVVERIYESDTSSNKTSGNRKPKKEFYKHIYKCFVLTRDRKYELERGLNYELKPKDRSLIVTRVNNFLIKDRENQIS